MHKNDYRPPDRSRKQRFLTQEEIEKGKKGKWTELEITGKLFRMNFFDGPSTLSAHILSTSFTGIFQVLFVL